MHFTVKLERARLNELTNNMTYLHSCRVYLRILNKKSDCVKVELVYVRKGTREFFVITLKICRKFQHKPKQTVANASL